MSAVILTQHFAPPPLSQERWMRFAGSPRADGAVEQLAQQVLRQAWEVFDYRVCYGVFAVTVTQDRCRIGPLEISSHSLARHLQGCSQAAIFAATVGVGIDRLISRYSRISPARATLLQALGTERVEALCDAFCEALAKVRGTVTVPRFSPGYGDVPLQVQGQVFALLDCHKHIGVSLNQSLLMSPTKSVTAFVGMKEKVVL